jgi:nucleoside 2-deoxyribosyltransferase
MSPISFTSSCKGVCTWVTEAGEERKMKVTVFAPNLSNIRAWFDIPKRYYQRNKEMVEACDLLHAFISAEDGFIGGTRFEVEYAVSIGIPVQIHMENGNSEWISQYSFPFWQEDRSFLLSWEDFFHTIRFELGG